MIEIIGYKTISYNAKKTIKYTKLRYKTIKYIERCLLLNPLLSKLPLVDQFWFNRIILFI